ncbi:type II toxin-antitoxin system HipA family toxin [Oceaniserpentilla sp. 4NH20-0058]|uniref:type II toxin-antitoxin system HipA family toxin n=1 Tax=Oceaniserpentilla sp. 4NH20-0058 TaxID=3127660 RepID=UPI00310303AD
MSIDLAEVVLWGTTIAVVRWDESAQVADFQYTPEFIEFGIEVAPIVMPVRQAPYRFTGLNFQTFKGLPGLLADVLPDKFGNALIDQWLIKHGRSPDDFNPIERLCYTANRAIGALEFKPTQRYFEEDAQSEIDVSNMVRLASMVLQKKNFHIELEGEADIAAQDLEQILQIGTSAGGARAKAIINWNEQTQEILPGHLPAQDGFEGWLIKFDGVSENKDKELADPLGFGRIEYAYYLLAKGVGIHMMPSRLLEEGGRAHFMTQRFDRIGTEKRHMTSLCGLGHYDFNLAGGASYEQAFVLARTLNVSRDDVAQLFKRMVFNVVYRNQDDHTKNIAFLMDKKGRWQLSPAFDVAYSFNPIGQWTSKHQMSINGKRDQILIEDMLAAGEQTGLSKQHLNKIVREVLTGVDNWLPCAQQAGISPVLAEDLSYTFRAY